MTDNMRIWNKVDKTPPKHTKNASNGRFKFTCIDPQFQTMQATEIFGPYGSTWGMRNIRITEINCDGMLSLLLQAEFFYPDGAFDICVDQKFRVGFDTVKSLMTNAKSKALSYLGFGTDVFLGLFDDVEYVKNAQRVDRFGDAYIRDGKSFVTAAIKKIASTTTLSDLADQENITKSSAARGSIPNSVRDEILSAIEERKSIIEKEDKQ